MLAAISDQELMYSEIEEELFRLELHEEESYMRVVEGLVKKQILCSKWKWVLYYTIAPDILSTNQPPYSYESWKALSEG